MLCLGSHLLYALCAFILAARQSWSLSSTTSLLLQSIKAPCMLLIIKSMGSFPTAVRTVSLPTEARVLDFLASAAAPCDEEVMLR